MSWKRGSRLGFPSRPAAPRGGTVGRTACRAQAGKEIRMRCKTSCRTAAMRAMEDKGLGRVAALFLATLSWSISARADLVLDLNDRAKTALTPHAQAIA